MSARRKVLALVAVAGLVVLGFGTTAGTAHAAVTAGPGPSPTPSTPAAAPSSPAAAPGDDSSGNDSSNCGSDRGLAVYHGTNAERELHRAIPDPLKVGNFPCNFPAAVRGIRLDPGRISLVAGGKLQRTIPFTAAVGGATLPAITAAIHDPRWISEPSPGTYLLDAALLCETGTRLSIAAPAVTHVLLLEAPGDSISGSHARADFDGVDVTSYLPATKAPDPKPTEGRPFVLFENDSTLNVVHSTMRYLGSDETSSYGVSWRVGGTHGLVDDSTFEHNFFGVYTFQAEHVTFENSTFADNTFYGLDPHTNSSHLLIQNNDVYGNADHGIVFSRYVTDSVVRGNRVHDNKVNGIMMDYQSDDNVITGNTVWNNSQGIVFADSGGGTVSGNILRHNGTGIRMSRAGSAANQVMHNSVSGGLLGVQLYSGASEETFTDNTITGPSKFGFVIDAARSTFTGNTVSASPIGMQINSVATVNGGLLDVSKTALDITPEGIASINGVKVGRTGQPLAVQGDGVAMLSGTTYGLPRTTSPLTALDILGISLVLFAFLCEIVNVGRGRILRRRTAVAVASFQAVGDRVPLAERLVIRRPLVPAATPLPEAAPAAPAQGQLRAFRPDIEGLRLIAVLSVVLSHADLGARGGYVGVDVFFVISGFLITRQLVTEHGRSGKISFARFYARRARRILPAATLVTVSTLIASYIWLSPLRVVSVTKDAIAAAVFGANWRFAAQATNYFNATAPPSPFQHYWSLSVEEQFYVLWPLLLVTLLIAFGRRISSTVVLSAALVVVIGASLWASVYETTANEPYGYFSTYTRAWELALGALVAVTAVHWSKIRAAVAVPLAWVGLVALLASVFVFDPSSTYPGYLAVVPVLGAGAVIAAGCGPRRRGSPESLLARRPFQLGGRLSYSWYLWHWPILIIAPVALGHALPWWQRLIAMAGALLLSAVTFSLVEDPFRRRRVLVTRPSRAVGLGLGLIATSVVVALILGSQAEPSPYRGPVTTATVDAALALSNRPVGESVDQALAAQLTKSAQVTQLPADLSPPLSDVNGAFSNTHGCEVGFTVSAPLLPCNEFGDTASTTQVVLVGDSHAGMWLAGIDQVGLAEHWRVTSFTKSGCPFGDYPDYVNPTLKRTYTECNTWRAAVIARIDAMHPAMVIIGSEAKQVAVSEPTGLTRSIQQLASSGAKVVFLADTPSAQTLGSVPQCLAAHPSDIVACNIPRQVALSQPGRTVEIEAATAAGATVVDPAPWFCTATTCLAVVGDTRVYIDDAHITAAYATERAPQLEAALAPVLAGSRKAVS